MATYKGFSTINQLSQKKFKLVDYELIKQDLLNSLNTRRGSRLMSPREGCIVWELLYEPYTQDLTEKISSNIYEIVAQDPRISIVSLDLTPEPDQGTITLELNLNYTGTTTIEQLFVKFDSQNQAQII